MQLPRLGYMDTDKLDKPCGSCTPHPTKLDDRMKKTVEEALLRCDTGNMIGSVVQTIPVPGYGQG